MLFWLYYILTLFSLAGCACNFQGKELIFQSQTPYEKMLADQEYERQKKMAKPKILSELVRTPHSELAGYDLGGESDKNTAGNLKTIFYDYKQIDSSPEQELALIKNAEEIKSHPMITFVLSAHADAIGDSLSNHTLAQKRAQRVYDKLIALGVNKNQLSIHVAGASNPLVEIEYKPITNEEDFEYFKKSLSQNRRVNFIVESIDGIKIDIKRKTAGYADVESITYVRKKPKTNIDLLNEQFTYAAINFKPNSSALSSIDEKQLDKNIEEFRKISRKKLIVNITIAGRSSQSFEKALTLGTKRATTIYNYLLAKKLSTEDFSIKIERNNSTVSSLANKELDDQKITFELEDTEFLVDVEVPKPTPPTEIAQDSFPPSLPEVQFVTSSTKLSIAQSKILEKNIKEISESNSHTNIVLYVQTTADKKRTAANRKMAEERANTLSKIFSSSGLQDRITINLKNEENKSNLFGKAFFFNEIVASVRSNKKVSALRSIAKTDDSTKEEFGVNSGEENKPGSLIDELDQKTALEVTTIYFTPNSAVLPDDQRKVLEEKLIWQEQHPTYKLKAIVYIKGSDQDAIKINSLLAEKRIDVLNKIFLTRKNKIEIIRATPDLDNANYQINQDYSRVNLIFSTDAR